MAGKDPVNDQLPSDNGGYQLYKAAGKLAGKKALITGGDSGIGRAIAILYAMEGAESTIVYTEEEQKDAEETKRLVQEKGGKIHLLTADLRSHEACKNIVNEALAAMGRINILVLNHGTQEMRESIADVSEYVVKTHLVYTSSTDMSDRDQWLNTFAVNIHPFFFLSKYTLPQMKRADTIICCASVNPYIGRPDLLDYTSTKGAIVAFARGLSNQQLEHGIRVNTVCPGPSK